jgi:hypothetical protein
MLDRPKRDPASDPQRLRVAAHELGHYLTWTQAGLPIKTIWIAGRGDEAAGNVEVPRMTARDDTQYRAYVVGILAGRQADMRWCRENDLEFHEYRFRSDMRSFRRFRKKPYIRDVSNAELQAEARQVVNVNWPRIVRLTPTLARRGHL